MNGLQQYRGYQVQTVGPEDQVALLYDGARRFTDQALAALASSEYADVSLYTGKAQRILEELALMLNMEAGPLAHNLQQLYNYWSWRLGQGLIHKESAAFEEVSAALADMREAWAEAARQVRSQRALRSHG